MSDSTENKQDQKEKVSTKQSKNNLGVLILFLIIVGVAVAFSSYVLYLEYNFRANSELLLDTKIQKILPNNQKDQAIEFNNKVVDLQLSLVDAFKILGRAFREGDIDEVNSKYLSTLNETNDSIQRLKEIQVVEKGEALFNSAMNLFTFYNKVLTEDYKTVLESLKSGEDAAPLLQELSKEISEDEELLDLNFKNSQEELADFYNFRLN